MRVKKRFFTLMEMLLVLGILSLIAGFLGVNISKMLQEQRFRTEVSQVMDQLRLAQDLMLIHDTNVQVKFASDKEHGCVEYGMTFDTPIPKGWAKELKRPLKKLKMIHSVSFRDMNQLFDDSEDDEANIQFLSGGAVMSKGVLILRSHKSAMTNVLKSFVWIPGSPAPLVASSKFPEEYNEKDITFETRLSQITQGEIQAKEPEK